METGQAEFSGDVDLFGRINQVQMMLSISIVQTDMNMRFNALKSFYFLIVTEMKEPERIEIYNKIQTIAEELYSYNRRTQITKNDHRFKGRSNKIPDQLVLDLDNLHVTLENIYDRSGLKKKAKGDARHSLGAR